ncbi:MAG: alkane 1-monooxygenase [Kangiellaceae bacterium]|nr:alkane 1-monooxygenase [Kangiellaceae bacterium]
MLERLSSSQVLKIKKYGYLLIYLVPALSPLSYWLGKQSNQIDLFSWLPLFILFFVLPVADFILGEDSVNPDEKTETVELSKQYFYRVLNLFCLPIQLACLLFSAWVFTHQELNLLGSIGWLLSLGIISGILAIVVAHELIHKNPVIERWAGGLLLSTVFYGGFKVEHLRGHHVTVSTPDDASSSRFGQSLYAFLPHAYLHNLLNAWKLEKKVLERKGSSVFSFKNELFYWYGFSIILSIVFYCLFGLSGLLFFLVQSVLAFSTLEIINYIEHYGLHRRKLANGKYERTNHKHSWNSNFLLTNLLLFHLQRHSDHHAFPKRRYQVLRHFDDSPQLPAGYATMFLLALVPVLWFKVMNPRVVAYYEDEQDQLE